MVDVFSLRKRILVCGSRDYKDYASFSKTMVRYYTLYGIDCIITGMAKGPDTWAYDFAQEFNIPYECYYAQWRQYGKKAGYVRNMEMLIKGRPNLVLAFYDGVSKGTKNMMLLATQSGVKVEVIS